MTRQLRIEPPKTLWYNDKDGIPIECEMYDKDGAPNTPPSNACYQVSQFPTQLRTDHLWIVKQQDVDACSHPEEKIQPTGGWVEGIEGRECKDCFGTQTKKVGELWPAAWEGGGSRLAMAGSSGWDEELVLLMAVKGDYNLSDSILIAANLCERCLNLMLNHYGSDNGYPPGEEHCRTECDHCRMVERICDPARRKVALIEKMLSLEYAFEDDMTRDEREALDVERQHFVLRMGWNRLSIQELEAQVKGMGLELP